MSFKRRKVFFFNLDKVIAVRFRKNEQKDSAATPHLDSGDSVPEAIPGVSPAPALPSNSSAAYAISARIEQRVQVFTPGVSDTVQLALAGVHGAVGPIPLAGGPLQAAINGLLTILQTIDRHAQNKATIASLRIRLYRLWRYLCNAPSAHDGSEQSRRDELISLLRDISDRLTELDNGGLVYQSVTQALAGFSTELDHYLAEYAFAAQMHMQNDLVEIKTQLVQFRGSAAMDLPANVTRHCLTLVDATGQEHKIPMEFCMSRQQLNNMLKVLFTPDTDRASIQRRFMEEGQYDLCIDQGTQVIELTTETNGWSSIEAGTKVVMRVIIKKEVYQDSTIECNACGYSGLSVKSAGTKRGGYWTIDCKGCDRRYQISDPSWECSGTGLTGQATDSATMHLIRNMHVQEDLPSFEEELEQLEESVRERLLESRLSLDFSLERERRVRDLILRARDTMPTEPLPCPTLSDESSSSHRKNSEHDEHSKKSEKNDENDSEQKNEKNDDDDDSQKHRDDSKNRDDDSSDDSFSKNHCFSMSVLHRRHEHVLVNLSSTFPIQDLDHGSSARDARFLLVAWLCGRPSAFIYSKL